MNGGMRLKERYPSEPVSRERVYVPMHVLQGCGPWVGLNITGKEEPITFCTEVDHKYGEEVHYEV